MPKSRKIPKRVARILSIGNIVRCKFDLEVALILDNPTWDPQGSRFIRDGAWVTPVHILSDGYGYRYKGQNHSVWYVYEEHIKAFEAISEIEISVDKPKKSAKVKS